MAPTTDTHWRIINSKGDQIGPLYESWREATHKANGYRAGKRGPWTPYRLQQVRLQVVWTEGDER